MAYEKHNWSCGETVTADLLNRIEDGIADADNGYSVSKQVVFNDSVTTQKPADEAPLAYADITLSAPLADTIDVEFNGTTYTLTGTSLEAEVNKVYGAPINPGTGIADWSQYPFSINSGGSSAVIATETAGTYTLKITSDVATVTDEFILAVRTAAMQSSSGDDGGIK